MGKKKDLTAAEAADRQNAGCWFANTGHCKAAATRSPNHQAIHVGHQQAARASATARVSARDISRSDGAETRSRQSLAVEQQGDLRESRRCETPATSLLTVARRQKRPEWARASTKTVLFADETRATIGLVMDGLVEGRSWKADRGGGSVMLWAGSTNSSVVGPFLVPDCVEITAASHCGFLDGNFASWFARQKAAFRRKTIFMLDDAAAGRSWLQEFTIDDVATELSRPQPKSRTGVW